MDSDSILFYDGECGLCNGFVHFVLDRDRRQQFRFAPLQGSTARRLLAPAQYQNLDSIVLYQGERATEKSTAVLRVLLTLGGLYLLAALGFIVPRWLRDRCYDLGARNRHRLRRACRLPTEGERQRFLP